MDRYRLTLVFECDREDVAEIIAEALREPILARIAVEALDHHHGDGADVAGDADPSF